MLIGRFGVRFLFKKAFKNLLTLNVSPFIINVSPRKEDDALAPAHGRPPSKDPKRHETRIRMSDEDVEILDYCCKATGRTKADIIREGIREVYAKIKK